MGAWEGKHHQLQYESHLNSISNPSGTPRDPPLDGNAPSLPILCEYCLTSPLQLRVSTVNQVLEKENEEYTSHAQILKHDDQWITRESKFLPYDDISDEEEKDLLLEIQYFLDKRDYQEIQKEKLKEDEGNLKEEYLALVSDVTSYLSRKLIEEEEITSAEITMKLMNSKIKRLEHQKTITDLCNIQYNGILGTVNGLRLGILNSSGPNWAEMNAACGHLCFVIFFIIRDISGTLNDKDYSWAGPFLQQYALRPLGSKSFLLNRKSQGFSLFSGSSPTEEIPLYNVGWIKSLLTDKNFDKGLEIFIQCLMEIADYAYKNYPTKWGEEKIRVYGDKIQLLNPLQDPISIRYSNTESWNTALKIMLQLVEQILNWYHNVYLREQKLIQK